MMLGKILTCKRMKLDTCISPLIISSVQSLSCVRLFATPWIAAHQASLFINNSRSSLRLTSIESVMPSSHLILCHPLLLLPPIPPSIRVFSNESTLCMRWPKYWSFSFSIIPSKEIPGQISFRMDRLDVLAVQGTLKSLLQHHSSVQFSRSVVSDSLRSHGLQHARFPCPSPTPKACSNWCSLSWWCHPTISSSVPLHPLSPPSPLAVNFSSIRVSSNESALHIRWPKYWSFSFSIGPSNEYSRLISFRIDWFSLLAVQGSLKSLLQHHSSKALVLQPSAFFTV